VNIEHQGSGLHYSDHEDLVETIVSMKRAKYSFPGVDADDLGQDIRLMCWQAIEQKFDPDKLGKSLFHFVARVVDNALYNKFRGVYLDNNPPCLRCPEYIKETKQCRIEEVGCDRIVQYRDRMARKRAIAAPLSYNANLDSDGENDFSHHESLSVGSATGVHDLDDSLRTALDPNLVMYYDLMVKGLSEQVPLHIRRLIQQQVRLILDEARNE
jgi:hypothetical protein